MKKYQLIKIPIDSEVIIKRGKGSKKSLSNSLKILIWNTYKSKKKNFNKDLDQLCHQIDIGVFQEYHPLPSHFDIIENHKFEVISAVSFKTKKNSTGVSTLSKYKSTGQNFIRTDVLEPITKTPKISLVTKYKINRFGFKHLTILNVHAINFVNIKKFSSQINQLDETIKRIKGPIILAGDFNTWSKTRKNLLDELCTNNNLKKIIPENDKRRLILDHIYYKDINIKSCEILNHIKSSDHKPILIEIEKPYI